MSPIAPEDRAAACDAADEELRQACRPLFVLGTLGALSLFFGELGWFAIAAFVLVLASLLRFKRSRVAAVLICIIWSVGLFVFVTSHPGLPSWSERFRLVFFIMAIVSAGLAVRAAIRYRQAINAIGP